MAIFGDDWAMRRKMRRARPPRGPRSVAWQPPARAVGSVRLGRQMLGGVWHLAGQVESGARGPWDVAPPSVPFAMQLHGMGWLDDVMAAEEAGAVDAARRWVVEWSRRFGEGAGPGWTMPLTGRRVLRWIDHAPALLKHMRDSERTAFLDCLYAQAGLLARHADEAVEGLPRMEALTGLLYAGLALDGMRSQGDAALAGLEAAVARDLDGGAGLASRNPEALLEVAALLGWAVDALRTRGRAPEALTAAEARIVAVLRSLRHADGGLARFHGGGRGRDERLRRVPSRGPCDDEGEAGMGFVALCRGRTSVIVDAAPPPTGAASGSAGASTLAFEMTSGACPVIVNCGPGGAFGPEWHRAGRATASHSVLSLEAHSSARIGPLIEVDGRPIAPLIQGPGTVSVQRSGVRSQPAATLSHDGYRPEFGLTCLRRLELADGGRLLSGEESLRAVTTADKERFEDAQDPDRPRGLAFRVRFHLHPDADASVDMGGRAVSIALPSGEVWVFRAGGDLRPALEPSVFLEPGRLHPRPTQQVVLSDRMVKYAATMKWSLRCAQEAGDAPARALDDLPDDPPDDLDPKDLP